MADEMTNGSFDAQARYAALDERVTNLRTSFVHLESEMRSGFAGLNSHLTSLSNELRSSEKTPWPVIWAAAGVAFSVLMGIGGALYLPVLGNLSEIKADMKDLRGGTVPREELEARAARGTEDRARMERAIADIRADLTPRAEKDVILKAIDQRFADIDKRLDRMDQERPSLP